MARSVSLNRMNSLRMIFAGGLTSGREVRRIRTETEVALSLDDLLPPTARPWLCGLAFYPCSTAGESNSYNFLIPWCSARRRIDRSIRGTPSPLVLSYTLVTLAS
jgi:hypothetical protein